MSDDKSEDVEETPVPPLEELVSDSEPLLQQPVGNDVTVGGPIDLGGKFDIFPDQPLPDYDNGEVKAYKATDKASGEPLYALICEKHLAPRTRGVQLYSNIINPSLTYLVTQGIVSWPHTGQQHFVLLYRDNLGKPLQGSGAKRALGWKQDFVMNGMVQDMIAAVLDMHTRDFVHGSIRPDNMYDGGDRDSGKIIFGDALSSPPSYTQPVLYETITRAMADPIGRGKGTHADDLYSLGVSLAVIMRHNDPMAGMSNHQMICHKIEHGTYASVVGKDRFTGPILELLRGLLHDDVEQRWTMEEIGAWLDGRRLSPKQAVKQKKAARQFQLGKNKYSHVSILAMDMEAEKDNAIAVIEDGSLEQWIERSLEDEDMLGRVQNAILAAKQIGTGKGYYERALAYVSIALDPTAPIRYKGMCLSGDGVGSALTHAACLNKGVANFHEIFAQSLAMNWVGAQDGSMIDVNNMISKYENCRGFVKQTKPGYGIERCVYFLNQEAPCLSEKLKDYYVFNPEGLLFAFEDLCEKGEAPRTFLDPHIVAFLIVHDRASISSYLFDLNSGEDHKVVLSNLKCLATIQKRSKLGGFPNLAKELEKRLPVAYARYHDSKVRERLETSIAELAEKGDLVKMAILLDSADLVKKDKALFFGALNEYQTLNNEYRKLERSLKTTGTFGLGAGRDAAAFVSSLIASAIILFVALSGFG